jgi:hypothetical protein
MWDTRRERTFDTLTWFPSKVTMPLASSVDLIIAGANDIIHALNNPSANSPLSPLADSEVDVLRRLSDILTNRQIAPLAPNAAPALRVVTPDPAPTPAKNVRFPPNPVTEAREPDTFHNTTGAVGRRRRRNRRQQTSPTPGRMPDEVLEDQYEAHHGHPSPIPFGFEGLVPPLPNPPRHRYPTRSRAHLAATSDSIHHSASLLSHLTAGGPLWHHRANKAIHPDTGALVDYPALLKSSQSGAWAEANADEIGRLAQGYAKHQIIGTDTMHFIYVTDIPKGRKATYLKIVAADKPDKAVTKRVRWTCGGDKVTYLGDVSTKTADLTTAKILFNSILSTPDAKHMTIDIKNFYLNTPMKSFEYMRIPVSHIPADIMDLYNLHDKVHNGAVYVEIRKGMYGLPQAGRIANDRLLVHLNKHGYHQAKHTHGLFTHDTRDISFSLVVDDFGVKYIHAADAQHLIDTLDSLYEITTDWTGAKYLGLTLDWDYSARTLDISMPGYVEKALQRFSHPPPARPQHSPHAWSRPDYGAKTQFTAPPDDSPPMDSSDKTRLQEVIGTLLYYARAIDSTMLVCLGTLAAAQTKGTAATTQACTQLLNYAATHPDAVIRYTASDMILKLHSDASYLSEPEARSRVGGFHYLGNNQPIIAGDPPEPPNGAILVVSSIMKMVVASAAEAELGALFFNGQEATTLRTTLLELGHPQPATPMQTDNVTAAGIANNTVKQRRSKAVDMRFYWIRDRVRQGQFLIHWKPGTDNYADYFTKHHPPSHHRSIRSQYIRDRNNRPSTATPKIARNRE